MSNLGFSSDSDSGAEPPAPMRTTTSKPSKAAVSKFIDDAAEDSDDPDAENEDGELENDYVNDGFVVDEADVVEVTARGDLSDDSDSDGDEEGDVVVGSRLRKKRGNDALDEDDLELLEEARSKKTRRSDGEELFGGDEDDEDESGGEEDITRQSKSTSVAALKGDVEEDAEAEQFDDFIEDDLGDQGEILREKKGGESRAAGGK